MPKPGIYFGKLVGWGAYKREGGSPYVRCDFDVGHAAGANGWEKLPSPRQAYIRFYVSDKALPYSANDLVVLGFNGDFGEGMDFGDEPKAKGVKLECYMETGNDGNEYERWRLVDTPRSGGSDDKLGDDDVMRLNTLFKDLAGDKPKPAPKANHGSVPEPREEDIPF